MIIQMDFIVVLWVGYNMGRGHDYTDGLHCSAVGRGDMIVEMDFIVVLWVRRHDCTDGLHCSAVG